MPQKNRFTYKGRKFVRSKDGWSLMSKTFPNVGSKPTPTLRGAISKLESEMKILLKFPKR